MATTFAAPLPARNDRRAERGLILYLGPPGSSLDRVGRTRRMAEDIAQWLDELGLGRYARAFADNGVELEHLPHLTDDDLMELGLPLGPRRHLQVGRREPVR